MFQKPKLHTVDVVAYALLASVVLIVWSATRSIALLVPDIGGNAPLNRSAPVTATAPDPSSVQLAQAQAMEEFRQKLQAVVDNFAASEPNDYGIFIQHIPTGTTAVHNEEGEFITASLYKVFAAVQALRMVERGELAWETTLAETGGRNVKQCLWDSIAVSDNPCGRALRSISGIGSAEGLKALRADGYKNTDLRGDYPVSTARDVGRLMEHIYTSDLLPKDLNQVLLSAMLDQKINDRLPAGLDSSAALAHKTGDLEGAAHDAGIVYAEASGDYIIVVLSAPDPSGRSLYERYARFGDFMRSVHAVMRQNPERTASS